MMDIERDSDAPLSANNCLVIGHETPGSSRVNCRPRNGSSKAFALLDSLIERKEKDYGGTAASRPLDMVEFQHTRVEAEATPSKIPSWLIDEISRLDHLLIQADNVSATINSCYWSIGVSYREFCKVSSYSPGASPFSITHVRPLREHRAKSSTQGRWRKMLLQDFVQLRP